MEHIIAGYLRQVWEISGWLYEGQHGFRRGYSCESQIVTVCQDIADALNEGVRTGTIVIDFSKSFDLVPHDTLLTKIAETGLDLRIVLWVKEFLLGCSQRVIVHRQVSEEVRVTSGVPQGSILGPLLFLAYLNDIWTNIESNMWLFADDCIIYRKINDNSDFDKLVKDLNKLGERALENEMKINPGKSKAVSFTKARVKERIFIILGIG
jgi:retron-type reverse transcriptase